MVSGTKKHAEFNCEVVFFSKNMTEVYLLNFIEWMTRTD